MRLQQLVVLSFKMRRTDFHFHLPPELIAQRPAAQRSASRLLVLDGAAGTREDRQFRDLPRLLRPQDLLVFNDTRVVPARIRGTKESGGKVELLLERSLDATSALVQARASKGLRPGARVLLPGGASARMLGRDGDLFRLRFSCEVLPYFEAHGEVPLPPYVDRLAEASDRERYQTVFARHSGAVAAPTAGLHFDEGTFAELAARGIAHAFVTLHVGAGTFQPVREVELARHVMHEEWLDVPERTAAAVAATRAAGGRVVAVGTTVVRSLETAAAAAYAAGRGPIAAYRGATQLFVTPGHEFRAVDAMLTNFHLPESTLLMLCCAFVGRERLLEAYAHAIAERYRFFSYGDAMLLFPPRAAVAA
jgi:S-adenosylmethionine:tRNA ribosyltransferase-isomerase